MVESLPAQPLRGVAPPEQIVLPPTEFCPNSPMPVLIYRNFFEEPRDPQKIRDHVELCGWVKMGPVWKATKARHYHPNVHECYVILSGSSHVLYGVGHADVGKDFNMNHPERGRAFTLNAGDVIVHPAGTGHSNVVEEGKYEYLAFFPDGAPHWKSPRGDKPVDLATVREETLSAPIPEDPVMGKDGHLQRLWRAARERFEAEGELSA